MSTDTAPVDDEALARLCAQLDEIGRVRATEPDVIDAALLAGVPVGEVARRTGRDRAGLHRRRERLRATPQLPED